MNSPFKKFTPALSTDDALKAAKTALEIADNLNIKSAICGGLAMHLYGFTRATEDVDIMAEKELNLNPSEPLTFGGSAYQIKNGTNNIEVDWIVRKDELTPFYTQALKDRIWTEDNFPVITPEWLIILKHLAGRGKDHLDVLWLLRQENLADREKINEHVRKIMGKHAYWALKDLESIMLEADILKAKDNKSDTIN